MVTILYFTRNEAFTIANATRLRNEALYILFVLKDEGKKNKIIEQNTQLWM